MLPKKKFKVPENQQKNVFSGRQGQVSKPDESGNTVTNNDKLLEQHNFEDWWKQMYSWLSYAGDKN